MDIVEKMKLIAKLMFEDGFEARSLTINEAAAEITRLREVEAQLREDNHKLFVQMVGEATIMAENDSLRARLAEAEKVIKPFVRKYEYLSQSPDASWSVFPSDLRAAARWMEGKA